MLKKRAPLLLSTMATALLMASGVALAQTISCSAQDACIGTQQADTMTGTNNSDLYLYGACGADSMYGKGGSDHIYGGVGDDIIKADELSTENSLTAEIIETTVG
jgi:Ca2+-binding RTX toxin-like protein